MTKPTNEVQEVKKPRGRPSKYNDQYPDQLIELMGQGMLNCEICAQWGIHRDTFFQWTRDHEAFKEAYEIGLSRCEAWWVAHGREGALKGGKGFSYWVAIMNNKFGWVPGKATSEGQGSTTNIQIGNVNVLQNGPQLIESIKSLVLKHKDVIDIELIEEPVSNDPNKSE